MGGTTVDDGGGAVNACLRAALKRFGLSVNPADVDAVMGLPKPEAIRRLIEQAGPRADLLERLASIHADFVGRMVAYYADDPTVREVPGSSATFAALRAAGIRVGLCTGFSRDITQVILGRLGWVDAGLVDATVTSDEVDQGRPHPDMIRQLMSRLSVRDPARVLKVGDAPADLEEGTNAGCGWVIGVTSGAHDRQSLEAYPHTHIVGSVAEVPVLLGLPGRLS
jgi:phosphonatase-like hydrolase